MQFWESELALGAKLWYNPEHRWREPRQEMQKTGFLTRELWARFAVLLTIVCSACLSSKVRQRYQFARPAHEEKSSADK
jgi:hypothetical protein